MTGTPPLTDPVGVLQAIKDLISTPTARDRQVKIGPSALGDPCDFCLAKQLDQINAVEPDEPDGGSLPTWIGTSMHERLEFLLSNLPANPVTRNSSSGLYARDFLLECKVPVGLIFGYGMINGSTDMFHIPSGLCNDWKGSKKEKIRDYKLNGIPQIYRVQRSAYGLGLENLGYKVRYVGNFFIPRDGFRFSDIWWDVEPYDGGELAQRALVRATTIWRDYVQTGEIAQLGSDPDCFNCGSYQFDTTIEVNFPKQSTTGASNGHKQDSILDF